MEDAVMNGVGFKLDRGIDIRHILMWTSRVGDQKNGKVCV